MATLEELVHGVQVAGVLNADTVTVVDVKWFGSAALELTYKDATGRLGNQLLYRDDESHLTIAASERQWAFDADGGMLRLVSEAYRIHLAYLFDPLLAVHTSLVDPLPHQITAVYEEMLTRQPLRFLLADDPGAGKTIMAGLLIKELLVRGDLHRCLIVSPGSLVEQWQDELYRRFQLPFEILTNDKLESARTGNWFAETPLCIARLDKLSRDEDVQAKLEQCDWDLVVCDEAHKMSASFFGSEVKYTKRYRLGQLLSRLTRHFLLMTATPHNGKEADFQLFMALLDGDRFEGKYRDGVHVTDAADMMRRLVKEQLLKFDGTPLFPERRAYTSNYTLSDQEARLYRAVTGYVREEFNRADALEADGRRGTVGFALTALQRRLASSPEAIYQSLRRRRERLEKRLREERLLKRGGGVRLELDDDLPRLTDEDLEDLEDAPEGEQEATEERIVDQATAAKTIVELEAEIGILSRLEALALQVLQSGTDRKWEELRALLQETPEMFDEYRSRRKLLIFTEHRDTLNYLTGRIRNLLGRQEAVVTIHGGMGREDRRKAQEAFTQDKDVLVLIATDAAGEGINLQRAHLMVNYDLPWNPNRLEQRFGRIHRIGQTEVCHCWNLVANETREGEVYTLLLAKLEEEREALGGQVFDVLGKMTFNDRPLRELLVEAVRYGDLPDVRARLTQVVEGALDRDHLRQLLQDRALGSDMMNAARVHAIREDMERAEARRLQPHYIASFFLEAFRYLGGTIYEREPGRYEITRVPAAIRNRDRAIGIGEPVLAKYERITFEKTRISVPGRPLASFVCPGHPLLDATISLLRERHKDTLRQGAVLIDDHDAGEEPRALFYLEHAVQDGRADRGGNRLIISRRLQFVEMDKAGNAHEAGYAPYLDYRPLTAAEIPVVEAALADLWDTEDMERTALGYAVQYLVPPHLNEVKTRRESLVTRTMAAVKERLTKEATYWDARAEELKLQEEAGKTPRLNSGKARQRADELVERLQKRMEELTQERQVSPLPPVVIGSALVVPMGLLNRLLPEQPSNPALFARDTAEVERIAMEAVMTGERRLGYTPRDVSAAKVGYDIESTVAPDKPLRFVEVKGRIAGADTITVTRNEILTALNSPDQFILAVVEVEDGAANKVSYVRQPFKAEPDFGATSVNYRLATLLQGAETV
jgi:superfamily II DNA or RNA helicase